jgi:hypothetical protein
LKLFKIFLRVFFCCNRQVHRDFLITLYEFRTYDYGFITQNTIAVTTALSVAFSVPEATGLAGIPVGKDETVVCGSVY